MTTDQIVEETRQWPEDTVAELLDRITLAKHGGLAPEREAAWAEVAARRSAELDSGKEKLVPGHAVSARIRRIVGRKNRMASLAKILAVMNLHRDRDYWLHRLED